MRRIPDATYSFLILALFVVCASCNSKSGEPSSPNPDRSSQKDGQQQELERKTTRGSPLFDGHTLDSWKSINFGGEGKVSVVDGSIVMEAGVEQTGIAFTGPALMTNYEITLEAKRVNGSDFFCGLTFPVDDSHCTFVVGGWGGAVIGLSNIDDAVAIDNETFSTMSFVDGKWYPIRVRVNPESITCWIDDKQVVDLDRVGKKISLDARVLACRPLGISCFQTESHLRNIFLQNLSSTERANPDDQ